MPLRIEPIHEYRVDLPDRATNPLPKSCDEGRRRFLRQLGGGVGIVMALGAAIPGHGRTLSVDFEKLTAHPRPKGPEPSTVGGDALAQTAPTAGDDGGPPAGASDVVADLITENRAVWIEPGYLVLVQWQRPDGDLSPVEAFEGGAVELATLIASHVTSVDNLHNIDQLHELENILLLHLASRVAPARIDVLHLDHDCTTVCSVLDPSVDHPVPVDIVGLYKATEWK